MARKGSESTKLERNFGKLIESIDLPDQDKNLLEKSPELVARHMTAFLA